MGSHRNHWGFKRTSGSVKFLVQYAFWGLTVAVAGGPIPQLYAQSLAKNWDQKPADEKERRERLHQIRLKQIPLLEQFLTKYAGSPRVAESLYRLGEAHFESAKYFEADNNKQQASLHVNKALEALEKLRSEYPNYQRLDEALFVLGNSYIETKQMEKAGSVLAEISEKYPQSPVLKEASMLLGDFYFGKQQFAKAEGYYQTAAKDPKVQSYVFYKLAWVSMNLQQPARALQYFERVLALKEQSESSGGDYSREASREMVFAALEVHKSKGIVSYLQNTLKDPELIQISLSTLAKGLLQRSDFSGASDIYGVLQTSFPQSGDVPEWISAQLKAEESLGRTSKLGSLVARLNESAGADSSKVQSQVYNTAKKFHAEAKKTLDAAQRDRLYDMSIGYYQAFLQAQLPETQKSEATFYMGEAYYARGRFSEAALAYESAARSGGAIQKQAAWNWFLTAEKLADGFKYQGKTFKAASSSDEKYFEAARFVQNVDGITLDQKLKASYQSARLLYQLNDLERALPMFQQIAERYPSNSEGKLSAQLVLDIYNLRKDYKSVSQYAKAYQSGADSGTKAELNQLAQKAELKNIQEEEEAAKVATGEAKLEGLHAVAQKYFQFSQANPHSSHVDAALWAAIQNFAYVAAEAGSHRDESFSSLRNSFDLLTSKYANSSFSSKAINLMGKLLAFRKMKSKDLIEYARFRSHWESQMKSEPRESRGAMGMLVYKLSNDRDRNRLVREFASLPNTPDNREAYAYAQLERVKAQKSKMYSVPLNNLKTLTINTQKKMDLLDRLKDEVTSLAKLQIASPALEGLKILGDGYNHMADAMRRAPVPKSLTGENLEKYHSIVSEAARDLESKGHEAHKLADEKAREIDLSES